jgi:aromatic ring-opening dioxygenase catalytic subunit (LigB family)
MAELAGIVAASHAPLIARDWDTFDEPLRARITTAYRNVGAQLSALQPDLIVEIAPDHWTNFFIDNLPSVCIGVGAVHGGPPEPFLAAFAHPSLAGDAAFGSFLAATALERGFEPSVSHRLTLDHGFCIPLWRMELDPLPPVVPIVLNCLEPPMPSVARCAAWGELLAEAIAAYPPAVRIAIVASGGLSHSIGEPSMGLIDADFDAGCIRAFEQGGDEPVAFLQRALAGTGNGAQELRTWVVAHAAAGGRGFALVDYLPVPEVYVGCAWATWTATETLTEQRGARLTKRGL